MSILMSPELEGVVDLFYDERKVKTISLDKGAITSVKISLSKNEKTIILNVILNERELESILNLEGFFRIESLNFLSNNVLLIKSIDIVYSDEKEHHLVMVCKVILKESSNE